MHDWKSTAQGILTFLLSTFLTITAFLAPYLAIAPESGKAQLSKIMAGCGLGAALCKAWIAAITNNADATATATAINNAAQAGPAACPETPATIAATPKP